MSRQCLNRAIRRRLKKVKNTDEIFLIVDATLTHRSGKNIENKHKFRHGSKYVEGHQFTNFVLLVNDEVIPLASVPFYSKSFCRQKGFKYLTEIEMVAEWIEMLPESGLLPKVILEKLHFVLDSGYDAKLIQNVIHDIGAVFTMGLRSDRSVNGLVVKEYFLRNRHIPWKTIHLKSGNGRGTRKKRKFRVRAARRSHMKGFGEVNVVCSEKTSRTAGKRSRKYIVTSKLNQYERESLRIYAKRWSIETWHKDMKQNFGYGDCRSKKFHAIESHINFALCAYVIVGMEEKQLPKKNATIDQFECSKNLNEMARVINLFGGRQRAKELLKTANAAVVNG